MTDRDTVDPGVQTGDVIAGKYQVERILGIGGMGIVVAAHHMQLDEKVAIKLLRPEVAAKPDILTRFEREARAAVKIKSEHVARVIDVGRLDSGAPYMIMEYLEGGDLKAWLRDRGPMDAAQAAEFVLQVCEAVAEAHALGIVHRDLKPANLFCIKRADGLLSIKVLDFGISKTSASRSSRPDFDVTSTGAVVGSPVYMSPEQLKSSRGVDSRTDIWSLGIILYELVAGRVPFLAASLTELAIDIATVAPPPLRDLQPELPPGFEDVVRRCLVKERDDRTQNVGELAIALRDFAPKRAMASVERILRTMEASGERSPVLPPSGTFQSAYAETVSSDVNVGTGSNWGATGAGRAGRAARNKRSWQTLGAAAVGGAVALLVGGAAVFATRSKAPTPASVAEPSAVASSAPSAAPTSPISDPSPSPTPSPSITSEPTPAAASAPVLPVRPLRSPASPRTATSTAPPATAVSVAPATSAPCRIETEYDAEGQPHFKKVCN